MDDQESRTRYKLLSGVLGLGLFFMMAARVLLFYNAPDAVLIGLVPDDAFYYLQLAKNRAELGTWTFDGTTTTTGFHLLYGYFLAVIYHLFESIDWRTLYLIVGMIASLSIAAACYFSSAAAAGIFGRQSMLIATAPYLGAVSIHQSSSMMESWILMLLSSLTIYGTTIQKSVSYPAGLLLIGLGALGSLSRTDYGLLPFVLLLATTMASRFLKTDWQKRCFLVFLGSVIGILIATAHNYWVSGHFIQMSAQIKLYWSATVGHSIVPPFRLFLETALPFSGLSHPVRRTVLEVVLVITVIFFARCYGISRSKTEIRTRIPAITVMLGCVLAVTGYIVLYRHNSQGLQPWYAANLVAPVAILLAGAGSILLSKYLVPSSVIILAAYAYSGLIGAFTLCCAHQAGMLNAGLHLKTQSDPQFRYGSWNAGIIGFFSEIRLINLDGVVNDEIYDYMKNNKLFDYLLKNNIRYLVDYDEMIRNQKYRSRGGYRDSRFDRCVRPLKVIDGGARGWEKSYLRIFEVAPDCS
jgi:hypothetical protein